MCGSFIGNTLYGACSAGPLHPAVCEPLPYAAASRTSPCGSRSTTSSPALAKFGGAPLMFGTCGSLSAPYSNCGANPNDCLKARARRASHTRCAGASSAPFGNATLPSLSPTDQLLRSTLAPLTFISSTASSPWLLPSAT